MGKENIGKQNILRTGLQSEFWKLMVGMLDDFIVRLEKESVDSELPAEQYKLESEILIAKIQHIKKLKEAPKGMIEFFNNPEAEDESWDPY